MTDGAITPGAASRITPEFRDSQERLDEEINRVERLQWLAHNLIMQLDAPISREVEALTELVELSERAAKSAREALDDAWRAQSGR